MAGVLIYKSASQHYSFVFADDGFYKIVRKEIPKNGDEILWEKGNVSLQQIENSRKTKNDLVMKLNKGEKVDLEKELNCFFQ